MQYIQYFCAVTVWRQLNKAKQQQQWKYRPKYRLMAKTSEVTR